MLDLGFWELSLVAVLTILVFGPKELPTVLRTVSKWLNIGKNLARDFQNGLDDVAREAELDELKKSVAEVQTIDIEDALDMKEKPSAENSISGGSVGPDHLDAFDVPDQPQFPSDDEKVPKPNIDLADLENGNTAADGQVEAEPEKPAGAKA